MRNLCAYRWIALGLLLAINPKVFGACMEDLSAPDADAAPLPVKVWAPDAVCASQAGHETLPLVIISHGTGGSSMGHADTAIALANAGFVVAAIMHTGDNYRDSSYVGKDLHLISRPRHVMHVIDYLLGDWPHHASIDRTRIGMFGHSAGGFTALVIAGGEPDMRLGVSRCRERPQAWECQYLRQHGLDLENLPVTPTQPWVHDARVKALVIAAPCCGWAFKPNGLANVKIPVQLWYAPQDPIVEDSPSVIRELLPVKPEEHAVANTGHLSFLAPCDVGMKAYFAAAAARGALDICADPAGFDRSAFHEQFNTAVVAFFSKRLSSPNR